MSPSSEPSRPEASLSDAADGGRGEAHVFPDDIWRRQGLPADRAAALAEAHGQLDAIERFHGAPRDFQLVETYCRTHLPDGDYFLYGAGSHSRTLVDILRRIPQVRVRGIVDRLASVTSFEGYEVVTPDALVARRFDYVLLSHTSYEEEMRDALLAAGVPPERIIPVYADPRFLADGHAHVRSIVASLGSRRYEAFIVTSSSTTVVEETALARVFAPDRTLRLEAGRTGTTLASTLYETVDIRESLHLLDALIEAFQPRVVYVSSVIFKNFLGMWIKARHPRVTVIHELCDYAVLWPERDLQRLFGLSRRTIRRLCLAEYYGGQCMDLNVSKRGGALWEKVWKHCGAPYRLYFPCVQKPDPGAAGNGTQSYGARDIVYAGLLPAPEFLAEFKAGYSFLPVLKEVCARGGLSGDIYNATHFPGYDAVYADYMRDFAEGPISYHSRIPYEDLLREMGRFRYGWLCDAMPDFHPDRYVGVCNRWTGYVSSGLPVVMDDNWKIMGDLVRSFGAGIVVDRLDAETILDALGKADHAALSKGAHALRQHLQAHNEAVLADIERTAERPSTCD